MPGEGIQVREVQVLPEAGRPDTTKSLDLAGGLSLEEVKSIGTVFFQSGMFSDAKSAAQAITKVLAGQEMGVPPMAAMRGLYVTKRGNIEAMAGLMAALIKRSGKYDYDIISASDVGCEIEWKQRDDAGAWQIKGRTTFTVADATKAKLDQKDTYQAYGEDMLFNRALARGARRYCPDIFFGSIHVVGETVPEDLEKPEPFVQRTPDAAYKPPRRAKLHEDPHPAEPADSGHDAPADVAPPSAAGDDQPGGELFPPSQGELDALEADQHKDPQA